MIHKTAGIILIAVVILIAAGATVTSTGAGDSVPDWPLAYGKLIPPLYGNIIYEYTHRLIAGFVAIFILILNILCWATPARKTVRILSVIVLFAIILQALLGGLRVLIVSDEKIWKTVQSIVGNIHNSDLRIAFAVFHSLLAQTVLAIMFIIWTITSQKWNDTDVSDHLTNKKTTLQIVVVILFSLVFIQIVLGALIRHKQIALIITDFPTTFGRLLPDFNRLPYNPDNNYRFKVNVLLHFFHSRIIPLITIILSLWLFFIVKRGLASIKLLNRLTFIFAGLLILQGSIGAFIIWFKAPLILTIIHTVVGASLPGILIVLMLWTFKLQTQNQT